MVVLAPPQGPIRPVIGRQGEAIVAMMAMITKMARNEPKTSSIFFWPFWGFGSSTGIRQVSHPAPATARPGSAGRLVLHRAIAPRQDADDHLRDHQGGHQRDRQSPAAAVLVEHDHQ